MYSGTLAPITVFFPGLVAHMIAEVGSEATIGRLYRRVDVLRTSKCNENGN
jgi:hypothetical protein